MTANGATASFYGDHPPRRRTGLVPFIHACERTSDTNYHTKNVAQFIKFLLMKGVCVAVTIQVTRKGGPGNFLANAKILKKAGRCSFEYR